MPSIKDFEKNSKTKTIRGAKAHVAKGAAPKKKQQRRPGRDAAAIEEHDFVEDTVMTENKPPQQPKADQPIFTADAHEETEPKVSSSSSSDAHFENDTHEGDDKIHLNFYGSELLRARAPKAFEVADAIADEWMKDGSFEALPVGHPLAQVAAQVGLRKAKDIEKKLEEKGVFMFARMGYQYAKSKLKK